MSLELYVAAMKLRSGQQITRSFAATAASLRDEVNALRLRLLEHSVLLKRMDTKSKVSPPTLLPPSLSLSIVDCEQSDMFCSSLLFSSLLFSSSLLLCSVRSTTSAAPAR